MLTRVRCKTAERTVENIHHSCCKSMKLESRPADDAKPVLFNMSSAEPWGSAKHTVRFRESYSFFRGNHVLLQYVDASL